VAVGTATHVLTSNGAGAAPTFQAVPATGANTALSNLASVAINTALLPTSDNTIDLGSVGGTDYRFRHLYLSGNISDETNTVTVANLKTAYDHSQNNTQAHTDYMLNTGDTATGVYDFGGATSFEIPNGAGGTTVDTDGEICVDTTSGTVNYYDGTAERVLVPLISKAIYVESPVAADDIPVIRVDADSTIIKVVYAISGGTNWVGQIQEASDAQGTGAADTQAADSTVTGNTTVTTFSNASFDAGDYFYLKTTSVSGSVDWLHVTLYYRQDA
jgi:hypothetical protein